MNKLHTLTITNELDATSNFYKKYFDFTEAFTSDWYIQLVHDSGVEIGLMVANREGQADFLQAEHKGDGGIILTVETDDATKMYKKLKSAEAPIVQDIRDEEWGQRHFFLRDPAGVYIDVVQYL